MPREADHPLHTAEQPDRLSGLGTGGGVVTAEFRTPARPDLAQDLIGRVEAAGATWRAAGHEREAAPQDVLHAARHSIAADAQALRRIAAQLCSWPGRTLIGAEGSQAALTIALHCDHDPAFQVTLLRMLAEAVRRGEATSAQWAHLHDRCLVRSGRAQQFGTQYWLREGRLEMYPVADPESLGKRRADVSLPPRGDLIALLERRHVPHNGTGDVTNERSVA
ncbi:DUF6624 domain-containing protein [Streptomyces sp. NBC_01244]|uniref:DUF6624 domain-containing protein n=1 Tax=Streptomyces sp. NBC_01244 TaxID=2903797 RepID=UPI002E1008BA|nr:hypothetical protein OG247_44600 [Streptomyces sp. NBC_01244]